MLFKIIIAILFFLGGFRALWKHRHFLALSSMALSVSVMLLPNVADFFIGVFSATILFVIDQWFFGKRNYSLYRFLKKRKEEKKDFKK